MAYMHHRSMQRPAEPVDVNMLMRRLRIEVEKSNSRITEIFQEFDRLRHGHMTQAKFQVMQNAQLPNSDRLSVQSPSTHRMLLFRSHD
jgi:hypothetical protein